MALDDLLRLAQPYIPPALIAPPAYQEHAQIAAHYPLILPYQVGFEVILNDPTCQSGFFLNILRQSAGWRILTGQHPHAQLPPALLALPDWERLRALLQEMDTPGTDFYGKVGGVWLEFDIHRQASRPPDVFFALTNAPDVSTLIAGVFARLCPDTPPDMAAISACLGHLPAGFIVGQVGVMIGRGLAGVRLTLCADALPPLADYLNRIGWAGTIPDAAFLAAMADVFTLQIDITTAVLPRIGLEFGYRWLAQPATESRWYTLLDYLVGRGLCLPEKQAALLAFPGRSVETLMLPFYLVRGLSHIKLVVQPGHEDIAKAYFGIGMLWK